MARSPERLANRRLEIHRRFVAQGAQALRPRRAPEPQVLDQVEVGELDVRVRGVAESRVAPSVVTDERDLVGERYANLEPRIVWAKLERAAGVTKLRWMLVSQAEPHGARSRRQTQQRLG
jgi:hypothetical protein